MKLFRIPSISAINRRKYVKKVLLKLRESNNIPNNILDIGSGIKNWAYIFPSRINYHTVDLRDDVLATHIGDFFKITFREKYNLIIATELIEHLPNSSLFFKRTNDLLDNEGLLLISFPFLFKIHADPNDYFRFTLQGIKELSKNDFEILDSFYHGNKIQLIWETLVDGKLLYPLKYLNYIISKIDYKNKNYPLGFVVILKKKSSEK